MEASEYRQAQAAVMPEATLQAQVEAMARMFGWMVYHTHDSRRSQAGFPDLTMVRAGQLIFAELKSQKGRETDWQRQWLDRLTDVSQEAEGTVGVFLWRPADMLSGLIESILR